MSNLASRYSMMEGNINFQLQLHQEMTAFNDAFNLGKSISIIPPTMNDELLVPSQGRSHYINNPLLQDSNVITSNDTKEIKRRPYKRLTTSHFTPVPIDGSIDRLKQRRYTPATADDSSEAGPSGSSVNI
ncbi:unnamed protein product [Rhizophagus irregularis]|uniref:Uncharacterized protein n=1 Tax=Rhizophagus irregularis TaxID=588596 RepID=A0A2N1MKL4_9GLOM|nr:hypothetical protein RhiirC2_790744 [Rhizophagus irregularis]CAB4389201.1 unnamed protein product [Rhizophagus irregularis]